MKYIVIRTKIRKIFSTFKQLLVKLVGIRNTKKDLCNRINKLKILKASTPLPLILADRSIQPCDPRLDIVKVKANQSMSVINDKLESVATYCNDSNLCIAIKKCGVREVQEVRSGFALSETPDN